MEKDPLDLPDELIPIALKELGETPEIRALKLNELKDKIARLPPEDHIVDTSDLSLIRFLRGRKYDVDNALRTVVNMNRFHRDHPEWCSGWTAKEFEPFKGFFQCLKERDKERPVVVFRSDIGIKVLTPEFIKNHPYAIIRSTLWFMNAISYNVYAQVCGGILIQSFEGFSLWDNLTMIKACPLRQQIAGIWYVQNCVGFRFSGAYIFHQPSFITCLWHLASGLLSETIRSRCHFCGSDLSILKRDLCSTDILPVKYGGLVEDGSYDYLTEQIALENNTERIQSEDNDSSESSVVRSAVVVELVA